MTFRPSPSDVKLCNQALSRLSQGPITNLTPPSPSGVPARECERWYKPTVSRLLELHHWGLARKRGTMTAITNDRGAEWTTAYQIPADCAFPVGLSTLSGASGMNYYQGLAGLLGMWRGSPAFLRVGSILYARMAGDLDYVSYDITEAQFNSTFANIVELTLAAAMCFAITKNAKRETDLRTQATNAINIAIAQDMNQGNNRYGDQPSERDIARGTELGPPFGWNWDYMPGPI